MLVEDVIRRTINHLASVCRLLTLLRGNIVAIIRWTIRRNPIDTGPGTVVEFATAEGIRELTLSGTLEGGSFRRRAVVRRSRRALDDAVIGILGTHASCALTVRSVYGTSHLGVCVVGWLPGTQLVRLATDTYGQWTGPTEGTAVVKSVRICSIVGSQQCVMISGGKAAD